MLKPQNVPHGRQNDYIVFRAYTWLNLSLSSKVELRRQRKGSVSYGLGTDFSLPHGLVGDKVSESSAEPSPAGISEARAEISWCIVMVQRSGKVSRGTAVGFFIFSLFSLSHLTSRPKTSKEKKSFIHVPCHVLVKLSTGIVLFIAVN